MPTHDQLLFTIELDFGTSLFIVPLFQGFIVAWAAIPLQYGRGHLTSLLSCWVGFTATIWILLLLGTWSAYKAGSYVSACRAILDLFIVAAEPFIVYCIWGDHYLTALRDSDVRVSSVVASVAHVIALQIIILLTFDALYRVLTQSAAIIGRDDRSDDTGKERVNSEK